MKQNIYITHGAVSHPLNKPCEECKEIEAKFEEDMKNGKLEKILGKKLFKEFKDNL